MDPSPFVRLTVSNLALKIPLPSKHPRTAVHPSSSSPSFCKIKLKNSLTQHAIVPFISPEVTFPDPNSSSAAITFYLSKTELDKLVGKSIFSGRSKVPLEISVYVGKQGSLCGVLGNGGCVGKVSLCLDFDGVDSKSVVFQNGWVSIGKDCKDNAQFHVTVKAEYDPRFVFHFDGEPECSPQVFLIQGNTRQPVFTCNFSFRSPLDRTKRSSSFSLDNGSARTWLSSFQPDKDRAGKERKGWSITIHDLSGSPVAAASMVTPFVASLGTDRVSRSNPGSWLILRPENHTWKPWGRLEAWRERGGSDGLGYRFELVSDTAAEGLVLAESTINTHKGGKFVVDLSTRTNLPTPTCSPQSSGDFGNSLWAYCIERGFVMCSSVEGEGKCSKPSVEVGVQHVGCTEDAAAFVALAAAVDLSMDACKLFSHKLRKELCQLPAS